MTLEGDSVNSKVKRDIDRKERQGIVDEYAISEGSADEMLATPNKGHVATADSSQGIGHRRGRPTNFERLR